MATRIYQDYGNGASDGVSPTSNHQFVALKEMLDRAPAFERMNVATD